MHALLAGADHVGDDTLNCLQIVLERCTDKSVLDRRRASVRDSALL